jgi:hypothetical protein
MLDNQLYTSRNNYLVLASVTVYAVVMVSLNLGPGTTDVDSRASTPGPQSTHCTRFSADKH